jgi:hypothetical protein
MRKVLLLSILSISTCLIGFGQNQLKIGEDIYTYFSENPVKYNNPGIKASQWLEGTVGFYAYSREQSSNYPYIIHSCGGKFLFGILQGKEDSAYYIFDLNGDKLLDYKSEELLLPPWVIAINSPKKGTENNIDQILDKMYSSFNSNMGPTNSLMTESIIEIMSFYKDSSIINRDIVAFLEFYINSADKPELANYAITSLKNLYSERFGKIHPLLFLYSGETNLNLGNTENAEIEFENLLTIDPEFIPALFYSYRLEPDKSLAKKKLKDLKDKYPDHWMLKQQ